MEQATYNTLMTSLDVTEASFNVDIATANLGIAKLRHERCIAAVDLGNTTTDGGSLTKTMPKKAATQAATKAAAKEDIIKVKKAAEKHVEKTAEDLGADVKLSDVYVEGKVNLLGFLAPLRFLSTEDRAPYIIDCELDKTKHASAMTNGVMHLDLVQEVLDGMSTKAAKHENPEINKEGIRNPIGGALVDHMRSRVEKATLQRDIMTLLAAIKAGA